MEQAELELEAREHRAVRREAIVYDVLRHSLSALAVRGLRYMALIATVGLFSWVMWEPEVLRVVAASIFACTVFLPTLFRKGGGDSE